MEAAELLKIGKPSPRSYDEFTLSAAAVCCTHLPGGGVGCKSRMNIIAKALFHHKLLANMQNYGVALPFAL
jgi:hypothetical protein